ncbi:MAG: glycosyltransferase family 2 protein [Verrucomicrobiota bacterium]|nr:glycosyltransferase family 2 protein [Verrucomicrobiota bacterium]
MSPIFSIITPLFNKAPYIKGTIDSVLSQTMGDWEFVVVNNGSTDHGQAIVEEYRDVRLKLIQCQRSGPAAARNDGLKIARGDYVVFLDADDHLNKRYLESQLSVAQSTGADLIASGWRERRRIEAGNFEDIYHRPACEDNPALLKYVSVSSAPWAVQAVIIRRERALAQPWDESGPLVPAEDVVYWFRLLQSATIAFNPETLSDYFSQLPGARNIDQDTERWVEGCLLRLRQNIDFLNTTSEADGLHYEYLFRVAESLWLQAKAKNLTQCAGHLQAISEEFLSSYINKTKGPKAGLRLRMIVGLNGFQHCRRFIT